ncbi:MAG: hypothetical protein KJ063_03555 [Anaerolineae bacterium]|nr:hypothetical protein [Anaerolineae bacterium]
MDKHWMILRETKDKRLGEDFSSRMPGQKGVTEPTPANKHWQEQIIQGLLQMYTRPDDLFASTKPLRPDA